MRLKRAEVKQKLLLVLIEKSDQKRGSSAEEIHENQARIHSRHDQLNAIVMKASGDLLNV